MKARLVKVDNKVKILCGDGTIRNAPSSVMVQFFSSFDSPEIFSGTNGFWNVEYMDMSEYPAETLAYITDDKKLVVIEAWAMQQAFIPASDADTPKMLTTKEYAEKHNRSREVIKAYVREGRILGAKKMGKLWFIPENAPYPIEYSRRKPDSGRKPESER